VANVSIKVRPNTIHSIIGPNGAGKTTFFNLLSGNLEPTSGRVYFRGRDITHLPLHRAAHLGIGRSFQITNIFPNLTVLENVRLACQALGKRAANQSSSSSDEYVHRHSLTGGCLEWDRLGKGRSPASSASSNG
jgi:ABC-type branched-subunit amino acid transport system ATPase component